MPLDRTWDDECLISRFDQVLKSGVTGLGRVFQVALASYFEECGGFGGSMGPPTAPKPFARAAGCRPTIGRETSDCGK
jgi:hypothetical protein